MHSSIISNTALSSTAAAAFFESKQQDFSAAEFEIPQSSNDENEITNNLLSNQMISELLKTITKDHVTQETADISKRLKKNSLKACFTNFFDELRDEEERVNSLIKKQRRKKAVTIKALNLYDELNDIIQE
ncbi:hypothetical protein G9A89_002189 [Geosiphon pyriformis]|nr:hypothetical protein G9A89_002189 [Geosiphon pyriformis]